MAIESGDNPHVVRYKLEMFFHTQPAERRDVIGPKKITTSDLVAQLREISLEQKSLEQLSDFFWDMSYLSRSKGINALESLQEALKDASAPNAQLLRCGLELMLDQAPPKQVMETLTSRMDTQLKSFKQACKMVAVGATELQPGVKPEKLEEMVRQAAM